MTTNLLSIIIPLYNEEKTIAQILDKVTRQPLAGHRKQTILINDGSTDTSISNAKEYLHSVDIIQLKENRGMGMALKTGIQFAKGNIILFQDADLEYDPRDIPHLLSPFKDPKVKVVYGSRYKKSSRRGYMSYYLATAFFTRLINVLYHTKLTDAFTGYKVFRRDLIQSIESPYNDFAFNVDITTKIVKKGVTVHEVPIHYSPRSFSEGKKISPWIGVKDFWIIIKNWLF